MAGSYGTLPGSILASKTSPLSKLVAVAIDLVSAPGVSTDATNARLAYTAGWRNTEDIAGAVAELERAGFLEVGERNGRRVLTLTARRDIVRRRQARRQAETSTTNTHQRPSDAERPAVAAAGTFTNSKDSASDTPYLTTV